MNMSHNIAKLAGAALIAAAISVAPQAAAKSKSQRCAVVNEAQVNALFKEFNDGFQTQDPDVMVPLFSRDAVLLPTVSGKMRTDAAGIRDYFVSFLKNKPFGTITESETSIGCNIATRVGNWTVRLTNPATGEVSDASARFSFVYVLEGGKWKIAHLHSSLRPTS
jgi:uncharacterized protein (TIGR02246 family)